MDGRVGTSSDDQTRLCQLDKFHMVRLTFSSKPLHFASVNHITASLHMEKLEFLLDTVNQENRIKAPELALYQWATSLQRLTALFTQSTGDRCIHLDKATDLQIILLMRYLSV